MKTKLQFKKPAEERDKIVKTKIIIIQKCKKGEKTNRTTEKQIVYELQSQV